MGPIPSSTASPTDYTKASLEKDQFGAQTLACYSGLHRQRALGEREKPTWHDSNNNDWWVRLLRVQRDKSSSDFITSDEHKMHLNKFGDLVRFRTLPLARPQSILDTCRGDWNFWGHSSGGVQVGKNNSSYLSLQLSGAKLMIRKQSYHQVYLPGRSRV